MSALRAVPSSVHERGGFRGHSSNFKMRFSLLVSLITLASTVAFGLQEPLPRPTHVGSRSVQTPLHVLQIHAPPRDSYDGAACSQVVVQNDFTASYGKPYIGQSMFRTTRLG